MVVAGRIRASLSIRLCSARRPSFQDASAQTTVAMTASAMTEPMGKRVREALGLRQGAGVGAGFTAVTGTPSAAPAAA